jgi:serine/threonine protein phosphatase PrpC
MPDWIWTAAALGALFVIVFLWSSRRNAPARARERVDAARRRSLRPQTVVDSPSVRPKKSARPPDVEEVVVVAEPTPPVPRIAYDEDEDVDATKIGPSERMSLSPPTQKIVYDEDAARDEPTQNQPLILISATAQTDRGARRKRNEDSVLVREDDGLFVVADGMGGYRGGEIASSLAVQTIGQAFSSQSFPGPLHDSIPKRASELARAIQMANDVILDRAERERHLEGMGTTVCAARFSRDKQRLYIGHVGDSRVYRMRSGALEQMTSDHTMSDLGVTGTAAGHLSRAVGVWPTVPIDILLGKPEPGDVYLLCSDGLTKMVPDTGILDVLKDASDPGAAVDALINAANSSGGKDNITVVVVQVAAPDAQRAA